MANRQTTGAVHITELGVNIQPAIDSLNELKSQIENFSSQMEQNPVILPIGGDVDSANEKVQKLDASMRQFFSTQRQIETLNTSWRNFLSQVERVDVSTQGYTAFRENVQQTAQKMEELAKSTRDTSVISEKQIKDFRELAIALQRYKGEFADFKNPNAQIQALSKEIETTVKQLDRLSSKTIKSSSLSDISALKSEYQSLNEQIKNGIVSAEEAQVQMEGLGQRFNELTNRIEAGDGVLNNFFTRLGNRVAWMAAMSLVNLVRQAFSNFIGTIQETEDAVIEVQRVLGDTAVTNEQVAQTLYDIAYEYGQTFENVQDAFVKFVQTGMDFQEATEAVRATMLALNTAELEVSEATTGLIAVISQFGYEGSDLEAIIDKINITADNFAVTSEKIVSALQRAGGTAKAFGMSLDETIAVITALSEATGRAGANIGTALNSLILFSQKSEAIKKFSEFLGQDVSDMPVLELWEELSDKIQGNEKELAAWMAQSEAASELFTEDMAEVIGATEDYAAALEAADKGVFSAVGTYRQNYFIALLQNFGKVEKVLEKMNESAGYSARENETAMEALSKRVNQLIIAAKELAVQFGEKGFLDFLKFLTDAGTGILRVTKDIGGLRTVLTLLVSVLIAVKGTQIGQWFGNLIAPIKAFVTLIPQAFSSVSEFRSAIDMLKTSFTGFLSTGAGVLSFMGLITTATMAAVSAWNSYQEKLHQQREELISQALSEYNDEINQTYREWKQLNETYEETGKATDELKIKSDALLKSLQENGVLVDATGKSFEILAQNASLAADELERILRYKYGETAGAVEAAGTELINSFSGALNEVRKEFFSQTGRMFSGNQIPITIDLTTQDGQNVLNALDGIVDTITDLAGNKIPILNVDMSNAEGVMTTLDTINEMMDRIVEAYGGDISKAVLDPTYKMLLGITMAVKGQADNYDTLTGQLEAYGDALDGIDQKDKPLYDIDQALTSLSEKYDEVTDKTSAFAEAYDTLIDTVNDYNDSGLMTNDMLEKLLALEPEYLAVLEEKNGKLYINEQQTQNLISANDAYLQQLAALRVAEEIDKLAKELQAAATQNLTIAEFENQAATALMSDEIYKAALNMINGTGTAADFANALQTVAQSAGLGGDYLAYFNAQAQSILGTYKNILSIPHTYNLPAIQGGKVPSGYGKGSGGSGSSSADNAAKKALQAEIKAWQQREKDVKDYYKKLKETTEDYYDGLIEQLEDVEEANDRINKQLDYYNNRQEALRGLEQARSRSGVEAREKEVEYQQKLIELDDDWRQTQEEWDIEDRIDQLKEMKEFAVQQIEDALEAATKAIEDTIEKLQEKVNALSTNTGKSLASGISSGIGAGVTTGMGYLDTAFTKTHEFTNLLQESQAKSALAIDTTLSEAVQRNQTLLDDVRGSLTNWLPTAAYEGAKKMYNEYAKNFSGPLKRDIKDVMAQMQATSTLSGYMARIPTTPSGILGQQWINPSSTTNNISMFANINGASGTTAVDRFLNGSLLRASRFS